MKPLILGDDKGGGETLRATGTPRESVILPENVLVGGNGPE